MCGFVKTLQHNVQEFTPQNLFPKMYHDISAQMSPHQSDKMCELEATRTTDELKQREADISPKQSELRQLELKLKKKRR